MQKPLVRVKGEREASRERLAYPGWGGLALSGGSGGEQEPPLSSEDTRRPCWGQGQATFHFLSSATQRIILLPLTKPFLEVLDLPCPTR